MNQKDVKIIKDNGSVTKFIKFLKEHQSENSPFTPDEEIEFIKKNKDNPEYIKKELMLRNARFVINIAKQYAFTTDSFDDTVQNGFLGLAIAADKFDINSGTRFCTYAWWYIKKYILMPYYDSYSTKIKHNSLELNSPMVHRLKKMTYDKVDGFDLPQMSDPSAFSVDDPISGHMTSVDSKTLVDEISSKVKSTDSLSAFDKDVYDNVFVNFLSVKRTSEVINAEPKDVLKSKNKIREFIKTFLATEYNIVKYSDI